MRWATSNRRSRLNPELSEAWFRIGLVEHHGRDLDAARSGYKKCLKLQSGHAWANFYLGLLEEQTGDPRSAMQHYEMAFKHAPELADPKINPEILSSRLQLGAQVKHFDSQRFEKTMPMPFLEPATVRKVRRGFESAPTLIPAPEAVIVQPTPTPAQQDEADERRRFEDHDETQSKAASTTGAAATGAAVGSADSETIPDANSTPYGVPETVNHGCVGVLGRENGPANRRHLARCQSPSFVARALRNRRRLDLRALRLRR